MNLIRVISHQETLQNESKVRVTLKSNGVLRYVFSVGSKEIFSSVYASGDTEYFNSSAQISWYINPINEMKPTQLPKDVNESKPTQTPTEINEDKLIQYLKNEIWFRAKPSGVDGVGLFAIRDIPEGTNILVETSQFDDGELGRHISFKIKKENMLDLHPNIKNLWKDYCHGDNIWQYITIPPNYKRMQLFFMNHSHNPNSYVNFVGDVREHITNKEIKENEEIFHNYKTNHRWAEKLRNFY